MRAFLRVFSVLTAATLAIVACNQGPLFYAEIEEPSVCTTLGEVPFDGTQPGQELSYEMPVPIGALPLFDTGNSDGGASDTETEVRLIELHLIAEQGIADFNAIDTSTISVKAPPGSTLQTQPLLTYVKDPTNLPGTRLVVAGDRGVNLVPYLFDASGMDAGAAGVPDAGQDRSVMVQAVMTGTLPDQPWSADIRVCIYMRTRFNYLAGYGL